MEELESMCIDNSNKHENKRVTALYEYVIPASLRKENTYGGLMIIIAENDEVKKESMDIDIEYFDGYDLLNLGALTGARKTNAVGAVQYMIDHFSLEKIIVAGTCAGIDTKYKTLDILVPSKAVQYDCTVKEIEPLLKKSFIVDLASENYEVSFKGTIGTADKAVVMWKDYLELKENAITIADTEAASIAYIAKKNEVECIIIKGISDFPINEEYTNKNTTNEEQMNVYLANTPLVMNKIFEEYLEKYM